MPKLQWIDICVNLRWTPTVETDDEDSKIEEKIKNAIESATGISDVEVVEVMDWEVEEEE